MNRWAFVLLTAVLAHQAGAQDSGAVKLRLSLEEGVHVGRRAPALVLPYATADSAGPASQPFDLAKEVDQVVVLIFYPRDEVPGVAEDWRAIVAHEPPPAGGGVELVGISADSVAAHVRFARELGLPFKLLSDRTLAVARRYGAIRGREIAPMLVVVGRGGRVRYVDPQFAPRIAASYVHLDAAIRTAKELR